MRNVTAAALALPATVGFLAPSLLSAPPPLHDIVSRSLSGFSAFGDATLGNGWQRTDTVTNLSDEWTIIITSIGAGLLNPEDLGFEDIYGTTSLPPTNVSEVLAAAASAYPQYHPSWGANWWPNENTDEVEWQSLEVLSPSFPIVLEPGESAVVVLRAHNTILGCQPPCPVNQIGELVIGLQYNGAVVPIGGSIGACCMGDGSCAELQEADCNAADGNYEGDLVLCSPSLCPLPVGACCLENGDCLSISGDACAAKGGTYHGDFSACTEELCPEPCPADVTGDDITNIQDLVAVISQWNCGTPFGSPPPCSADATGDGAVNVQDLVFIIAEWNCGFVRP